MAKNMVEFKGIGSMYPLFTKTELCKRWGITIHRLNNWELRHDDFPPRVVGLLVGNSVPIYSNADIKSYEESRGGSGGVAMFNAALGGRS